MVERRSIILDTDLSLGTPRAEIDDGAALIFLLNSPEIDLRAITTVHGNVPVDLAVTNVYRIMDFFDRKDIPVGSGAAQPLVADPKWDKFLTVWRNGYGITPSLPSLPNSPSAVDLLIETIQESPGEITVLALGPFTNLALALQKSPHIAGMVRGVVAMGASSQPSSSSIAEFNVRCDPEAAAIVFSAAWPLHLHGLDITRQVLFSRADFAGLEDSNQSVRLLKSQAVEWISVVEEQGWENGGCSLHDAVAAAALLDDTLCEYERVSIEVDCTQTDGRGKTQALPANLEFEHYSAAQVDSARCHALILERLK